MNENTLVFATNNAHKAEEIRHQLGNKFGIITLKEAGIFIDIPEPHDTLEANASEKSSTIVRLTGRNCFSEDTGLEVDFLNGRPGVKTARFVEKNEQFDSNVDKLLFVLKGELQRQAKFRTVISLQIDGREWFFEGLCKGSIAHKPLGTNGFGYDPVFIPEGSEKTFAQMTLDEKTAFSHRARAVIKLAGFLDNYGR
jgi:XTP/dITP diphosphohydrolase